MGIISIILYREGDEIDVKTIDVFIGLDLSDLPVIYDLGPAAVALTVHEHLGFPEHNDLLAINTYIRKHSMERRRLDSPEHYVCQHFLIAPVDQQRETHA